MTLIFVVMLPLISIALGHIVAKHIIIDHFISSFSTKKQNKNVITDNQSFNHNTQTTSRILKLEELNIYSIQIGSFFDKENAQNLVEELNNKGFGAYILPKSHYRIFAISTLDKKNIESLLPIIQQEYNKSFIFSENIPEKNISCDKIEEEYISLLQSNHKQLIDIFKKMTEATSQLHLNGITTEQYKLLATQNIQKLQNINNKLKIANPSNHTNNIYLKFNLFVNNFEKSIRTNLKYDQDKKFVQLQNTIMVNLYKYLDLWQKIEP